VTDSTTCSNCGTTVPAAAAFCTNCGTRMGDPAPAAAPAPSPSWPPGADATRVDTPGLHDATAVTPTPAAAPWAPPGDATPPPAPFAPPAPPAPPLGGPTYAPPGPPAPPPGFAGPGFGAPSAPPPTTAQPGAWGAPAAGPPSAWNQQASPTPAGSTPARSPIGALLAIVGGIATIAGVFSGWASLEVDGTAATDSGWALAAGEGFLKTATPQLVAGLGVAAILVGVLLLLGAVRPLARLAAVAVGIGIVIATGLSWMEIAAFVEDELSTADTAETAIGIYLAIGGGVVTAVAALLPAKKAS
jgi:hypothetical protein